MAHSPSLPLEAGPPPGAAFLGDVLALFAGTVSVAAIPWISIGFLHWRGTSRIGD